MLKAPYILLAEDSDDDTFFARRCFAASGVTFDLQRCVDGRQLVSTLQNCGSALPRAVILDLKMPLMDGFETLQWIRQQPAFQKLPVVVLSSSGLPQDMNRARELGATEYLLKPHTLADLEKMLKKLADRLEALDLIT